MVRMLLIAVALAALTLGCSGSDSGSLGIAATSTRSPQAGPRAEIEPRSVPPGAFVTISGSGWPAGETLEITGVEAEARPYTSVVVGADGSFSARFRVEKTATGETFKVGRYDLVARAGAMQVNLPLLMESPRPLQRGEGG